MAKLTITDAARVTGVSRMLLYRYIKSGKLSRTPERVAGKFVRKYTLRRYAFFFKEIEEKSAEFSTPS